ncbi:MAG: hypothetical protein V1790_08525 [Planctomycetota bacterium]
MDLDVLNDKGLREQPTTEVGGYFVANYPPFSVWFAAHVPATLALVCVSLVTRPPSAATVQKFFGAPNDAR